MPYPGYDSHGNPNYPDLNDDLARENACRLPGYREGPDEQDGDAYGYVCERNDGHEGPHQWNSGRGITWPVSLTLSSRVSSAWATSRSAEEGDLDAELARHHGATTCRRPGFASGPYVLDGLYGNVRCEREEHRYDEPHAWRHSNGTVVLWDVTLDEFEEEEFEEDEGVEDEEREEHAEEPEAGCGCPDCLASIAYMDGEDEDVAWPGEGDGTPLDDLADDPDLLSVRSCGCPYEYHMADCPILTDRGPTEPDDDPYEQPYAPDLDDEDDE